MPHSTEIPKHVQSDEEICRGQFPGIGAREEDEFCIRCGKPATLEHRVGWLHCNRPCFKCNGPLHLRKACPILVRQTHRMWWRYRGVKGNIPGHSQTPPDIRTAANAHPIVNARSITRPRHRYEHLGIPNIHSGPLGHNRAILTSKSPLEAPKTMLTALKSTFSDREYRIMELGLDTAGKMEQAFERMERIIDQVRNASKNVRLASQPLTGYAVEMRKVVSSMKTSYDNMVTEVNGHLMEAYRLAAAEAKCLFPAPAYPQPQTPFESLAPEYALPSLVSANPSVPPGVRTNYRHTGSSNAASGAGLGRSTTLTIPSNNMADSRLQGRSRFAGAQMDLMSRDETAVMHISTPSLSSSTASQSPNPTYHADQLQPREGNNGTKAENSFLQNLFRPVGFESEGLMTAAQIENSLHISDDDDLGAMIRDEIKAMERKKADEREKANAKRKAEGMTEGEKESKEIKKMKMLDGHAPPSSTLMGAPLLTTQEKQTPILPTNS